MNTLNTSAAPASGITKKRAKQTGANTARVLITLLIVLLVSGGAYWYFIGRKALTATSANTVTYNKAVERGSISVTAKGQGTLVTKEAVNMAFSTSGKVAEVNVKLGDMVKKGDVLARLEKAEDLEANLASAQANLLKAQQDLADLQKKAGSTLALAYKDLLDAQDAYNTELTADQRTAYARCSPEIVTKYKAALESATQKLNDLYKLEPSSGETTIARYDYDTALANYNYCAAYTATEKTSANANLEIARSNLDEKQTEYEKLKEASGVDPDTLSMYETRVETAQTQVNTAQEALDGTTLIASMDGKITNLAADAGTIVDTSTILTISDVSHPTVTVSLDETDMDALVVGNPAKVTFTALSGETFNGKVSLANPAMVSFGPFRAASGQVELNEEYASQFQSLPLGMSATVVITGQEAKNVLLVPVDALKELKNGDYSVSLVGSDGTITQQIVTVGLKNSANAEITGGLKEGDIVSITKTVNNKSTNSFGGEMPGGGIPGGVMPIP